MVGLALFVLFLVVPAAELYVIFKAADAFGWLDTVAILVVMSVLGAWLVKRAGLRALMRIQTQLAQGELPTAPLIDGLIVLVAGALMLTPGFLTDIVGLLLLVPPVRAGVRKLVIRRYRGRIGTVTSGSAGPRSPRRHRRRGDVIDADSFEVTGREIDP